MHKERAIALAEALESGEFPQGFYALDNRGKFCCLGVASFLAAEDGACFRSEEPNDADSYGYSEEGSDQFETGGLLFSVHEWLGLSQPYSGDIHFPEGDSENTKMANSAMGMNDSKESFKVIAAKFRKHYAVL
jgi:hypothetical protein